LPPPAAPPRALGDAARGGQNRLDTSVYGRGRGL
jgi:hypothetical protein